MRNLFKKFVPLACAAVLCCSAALPCAAARAGAAEKTPIDMYLIAGQSNAAGYSTKGYADMNGVFENVGYGGEVQRYFRTGAPSSSSYLTFDRFKWQVKKGLGAQDGYIGPEYGMAEEFSKVYADKPDGRKAFIFKTAAGGTSLRDVDDAVGTTTYNYGNWYPRSLWPEGYKPNTAENLPTNKTTGYLYALFMENFEKVYTELKNHGYEPVVKGLAWMQGCQDLGFHVQYEELLKTFITDIRADLADVTGDDSLKSMPFVIGKIATSFGEYGNPKVPPFNAVQQKVADEMGESVATIESSDLIIVNPDGSNNGTDIYHFNCGDAEKLGKRFGQKLLELNDEKLVSVSSQGNGSVQYRFTEDNKLVFTLVPDNSGEKKYRVSKFAVNGEDVTAQVTDNTYTLENPSERTYAEAEFAEAEKFRVTYEMNEKYVSVAEGMRQVYSGDTLNIRFAVKKGYEIEKVTVNGVEISPAEEGKYVYTVENVTQDTVVKVTHREEGAASSDPEKKGGCNGSLFAGGSAFAACAAAASLAVRKKRR